MSREYPKLPLAGVGVVVMREAQTLLIRRGKAPRHGEWSIPGGLQKLGETIFEAARREVLEETGVLVDPVGLIDVIDLIERDEPSGAVRYHYTLIDLAAHWRQGDAVAAADAIDVAWTDLDSLPHFQLWAETERVIRLAHQKWPNTE